LQAAPACNFCGYGADDLLDLLWACGVIAETEQEEQHVLGQEHLTKEPSGLFLKDETLECDGDGVLVVRLR
jgi:hypothetical protein